MSDQLDRHIDRVAASLTHVDEDREFHARIVQALPERVQWFGWLTHSWAPRLAMIAIVAGLGFTWSNRATTVTPSSPPLLVNHAPALHFAHLMAAVEPARSRTEPLEPLERVEPLEPLFLPDHAFALPAIAALGGLSMNSLAPEAIAVDDGLVVTPLDIIALESGESMFPR